MVKNLGMLQESMPQPPPKISKYVPGHGYDGASAMSGYLRGAQEYIKEDFLMALYVHCSALYRNVTQSCVGKRQLIALNKKLY